jgi:hypothetical protein
VKNHSVFCRRPAHGPELINLEDSFVVSNPLLRIDDIAAIFYFNDCRHKQHNGAKNTIAKAEKHYVKILLMRILSLQAERYA